MTLIYIYIYIYTPYTYIYIYIYIWYIDIHMSWSRALPLRRVRQPESNVGSDADLMLQRTLKFIDWINKKRAFASQGCLKAFSLQERLQKNIDVSGDS